MEGKECWAALGLHGNSVMVMESISTATGLKNVQSPSAAGAEVSAGALNSFRNEVGSEVETKMFI